MKELLLFKVDFEKANDFIDWGYLDEVMRKMGFPTLVNRSPKDGFPLERGLSKATLFPLFSFSWLRKVSMS